jgi:hypothetical protein
MYYISFLKEYLGFCSKFSVSEGDFNMAVISGERNVLFGILLFVSVSCCTE